MEENIICSSVRCCLVLDVFEYFVLRNGDDGDATEYQMVVIAFAMEAQA